MADLPGDEGGGGASVAHAEAKHDEPAAAAPQTAAAAEPAEPKHEEEKEKAPDPGELAYWPKLTGEFAQAAIELNRMKAVAYAFKKQQAEARKKAYEAATTYSKSGEDAEKKADAAKQHTAALGPTIDEAKTSGAKASEGSAHADKGSGGQGLGRQQLADAESRPRRAAEHVASDQADLVVREAVGVREGGRGLRLDPEPDREPRARGPVSSSKAA